MPPLLPRAARIALSVSAVVLASTLSGCYAEAEGPPPAYAYGYEPQYYDGYVVYYDDFGHPYYYAEGRPLWVPHTAPIYVGLVNHWHAHGPAYHRWYGERGYRYRSYRGRGAGRYRR